MSRFPARRPKKRPAPETPTTGTISSISPQVKDANRFSVYIEEKFAFGIHADLVLGHGLAAGMTLDEALTATLLREDEVIRAKQRALGLLAYRPRSRSELESRLKQAEYSQASIESAMERLDELGYIDDRRFAEEFVRARQSAKGYGPRRLEADLRKRGVAAGLVREVLAEAMKDHDPLEEATAVAKRYLPRLARELDPVKKRNRLYSYLARRGFEPSTIQEVIRDVLERAP